MELLTHLQAHIKKTCSPDVKALHDKCDKLIELIQKLNDRVTRVEQFKQDTSLSKITIDTTPVRPAKWIKRIEPDLDDEFKVQDMTPKECLKIIVPKNTEKLCMFFDPVTIKDKEYVVFREQNENCTLNIGKISTDHYLWAINGDKVEDMSFQETAEEVSNRIIDGCSLYFKRFSSAQKRARDASEDLKLEGLREKLWKQYVVFFSPTFRDQHSSKHHRYRPGCGSCSNKRAVEKLREIIAPRVEEIKDHTERACSADELFEYMDVMESRKYDRLLKEVEEPIEIVEPPKKKQKTLRDLYIAAGHPELTYDILRKSMSEDQIKSLYNL